MTPEQRAAMYAITEEDEQVETGTPEQERDFATSLRNAGGGMVSLNIGDVMVTIPSSAYTRALEKQIASIERDLRNAKNSNRHLVRAVNQLTKMVNNLQSQLDNKVDKLI